MAEVLIRKVYSALFCCSICSLQSALYGNIAATTNQRSIWRTEIPSYAVCQWSFT